jgi:hypothetical protein
MSGAAGNSLAAAALALASPAPPAVLAQMVARVEMHAFSSATLSDPQFLSGERSGTPVILAGELRLPRGGSERPGSDSPV